MQEALIASGGKYLTFQLAKESYGIEILKVREIIGLIDITAVPQTAAYIRGVINLRGKIIPVLDLRRKFGLEEAEFTKQTCIVTTQVPGKNGEVLVGLIVDAVHEVLLVNSTDIEPVPDLGEDMKLDFVKGLSKTKGRVTVLLDMDKVMQEQDFQELQNLDHINKGASAPPTIKEG